MSKAARSGHVGAQLNLGNAYSDGNGVPKDDAKAIDWWRKAALAGEEKAQFNLGIAFARGDGVIEDSVAAYAWWNIASATGSQSAKSNREILAGRMTRQQIADGQTMARELVGQIEEYARASETDQEPPRPIVRQSIMPADSQGTAFAVSDDGYLLTALHVVQGARRIRVTLADGRVLNATIHKHRQSCDLAVLKVDARHLQWLPIASASSISIGEDIFTVGFPVAAILGRSPKYTSGSLSSTVGLRDNADLMQMTIPIQPGNSGGPVVTSQGRVVGVVSSTAAVAAFLEEAGTLPQNVNWAVKADLAIELFDPPKSPKASDSAEGAVRSCKAAVCLVEAWRR